MGTQPPRRNFLIAAILLGLTLGTLATECLFQILEWNDQKLDVREGPASSIVADPRWGWKTPEGPGLHRTAEFEAHWSVNSLFMNDEPVITGADDRKTRILALGDSHTSATGVSVMDSWSKQLQGELNRKFGEARFRTYNAGTGGYSLQQYLLRLIDQGPLLKPDYVVLGFCFASDLYDLLPPKEDGVWIFFETLERDYYDFDAAGKLTLRHWKYAPPQPNREGQAMTAAVAHEQKVGWARGVRNVLEKFATFRYLRRSNLALFVGSRVKVGGESLWPTMEVLLEKEVSPKYQHSWKLVFGLLEEIQRETERQGAKLIVLGIPYLPQIYDDIWRISFGNNSKFDRHAGISRVKGFLEERNIPYVESLDRFREVVAKDNKWVHFKRDAHPNAKGHKVMSDVLVESNQIVPVR